MFFCFFQVYEENQYKLRYLLKNPDLWSPNSSAETKMLTYYQSCMNAEKINKDGARPLVEFIKSIGAWDLLLGKQMNRRGNQQMNNPSTNKE
jgi:hypothetical protein